MVGSVTASGRCNSNTGSAGRVIYSEPVARGMPPEAARRVAANSRRWWHNSAMALNMALTNDLFKRLGVPKLAS
jgi:RNA-directed DNA polymerase